MPMMAGSLTCTQSTWLNVRDTLYFWGLWGSLHPCKKGHFFLPRVMWLRYCSPVQFHPIQSPLEHGCCSIGSGALDRCRTQQVIRIHHEGKDHYCYKNQVGISKSQGPPCMYCTLCLEAPKATPNVLILST